MSRMLLTWSAADCDAAMARARCTSERIEEIREESAFVGEV